MSACRTDGGWRRFVLAVTLIAFALQSYVVQTHIHFEGNSDFGFTVAKNVAPATDAKTLSAQARNHGPSLPKDDPAHCPICQEFLHAGQYLTPTPVVAFLITTVVAPIAIVREVAVTLNPVSHDWHGRAPPRH